MGSTMPCCASRTRFFLAALFLLLCAQVAFAAGTGISVRNPQLVLDDGEYVASADFNINFNRRLEEAVNKGVVLYFAAEFELTKSRWYWFDQQVVRRSRLFQLSYHALTRQYRLSSGALHQSFATLDDALRVLSRVRHWQVIEKGEVDTDSSYQAGVRMRLDPSQMPKTFQVNALSNRVWNQSSEWLQWVFYPSDASASLSGDDQ